MKVVEFYRGERGNSNGHMLNEIWTWSHGALDCDHDWVQWLFASNEPSMMNCDAPVLTREESAILQSDPELLERTKYSFLVFLDFLGFQLVRDDDIVQIAPLEATEDRPNPQFWLKNFNHTMLRVSRLLKSLRLTGHTVYAMALYNALRNYKDRLSSNTFGHWTRAVSDPLWAEV